MARRPSSGLRRAQVWSGDKVLPAVPTEATDRSPAGVTQGLFWDSPTTGWCGADRRRGQKCPHLATDVFVVPWVPLRAPGPSKCNGHGGSWGLGEFVARAGPDGRDHHQEAQAQDDLRRRRRLEAGSSRRERARELPKPSAVSCRRRCRTPRGPPR